MSPAPQPKEPGAADIAVVAPTSSPRWCSGPRAEATRAPIRRTAATITTHPMSVRMTKTSHRVAQQGARHAVTATAALPELEPLDRHHLDARLAHLRHRVRVALVGDDDARLERDDVV